MKETFIRNNIFWIICFYSIIINGFVLISNKAFARTFNINSFYERYNYVKQNNSQSFYFLRGCSACNNMHEMGYIVHSKNGKFIVEYYKWNNIKEKLIFKKIDKKSNFHISSILKYYTRNYHSLLQVNYYDPLIKDNDTIQIDSIIRVDYKGFSEMNHYMFYRYSIKIDNDSVLENKLILPLDLYQYNFENPNLGFILLSLLSIWSNEF